MYHKQPDKPTLTLADWLNTKTTDNMRVNSVPYGTELKKTAKKTSKALKKNAHDLSKISFNPLYDKNNQQKKELKMARPSKYEPLITKLNTELKICRLNMLNLASDYMNADNNGTKESQIPFMKTQYNLEAAKANVLEQRIEDLKN